MNAASAITDENAYQRTALKIASAGQRQPGD
jgi:hypothetical protein